MSYLDYHSGASDAQTTINNTPVIFHAKIVYVTERIASRFELAKQLFCYSWVACVSSLALRWPVERFLKQEE